MQKVKYTTPKGDWVVFDRTPPYLFEKISGIGAEDAQLVTTDSVGQDGKTLHGLYTADREITVSIHIKGDTREKLYRNRLDLITLLSSSENADGQLGRLDYTNDYGTWWIPVAVKRGPQKNDRSGNYNPSVELIFYAPWPYWRAISPIGGRVAYMDGGLSFPLTIPQEEGVHFGSKGYSAIIHNAGDRPTAVEIKIKGPSVRPTIYKMETGEYIRVDQSLLEGDVLLIQTMPGERAVEITRADGTVEPAFGYLDLTSTLFQLTPGINTIEYKSDDDTKATEVEIKAYSQFGGV